MPIKLAVDISDVENLGAAFEHATNVGFRRVVLAAEGFMVEEVPTRTGNLRQGVGSEVIDELHGEVYVTAKRDKLGPRSATVHYPSGKTKEVKLRAVDEFNYAAVVAEGKPAQSPKTAKVFLIPVSGPVQGVYLVADGQMFILRTRIRAIKANPFHDRAVLKLTPQIEPIFDKAIEQALAKA